MISKIRNFVSHIRVQTVDMIKLTSRSKLSGAKIVAVVVPVLKRYMWHMAIMRREAMCVRISICSMAPKIEGCIAPSRKVAVITTLIVWIMLILYLVKKMLSLKCGRSKRCSQWLLLLVSVRIPI